MQPAKEKLTVWLENNADKWITQSFASIAEEVGISAASVDRYLPELIADRDGMLPSEVLRKRQEAGFSYPRKSKTDLNKVREIIENNPDAPVRDLAYLAKCSPKKIQQVLKVIKQENQSTDDESEVNNKEAEMEKLKARMAELSKS